MFESYLDIRYIDSGETKKIVNKKSKKEMGPEALRVAKRLNGFIVENSRAWRMIVQLFSSGVTHNELSSIAQIICMKTNLKLDRDAIRDNRVLIKWFDDNWETISEIIPFIQLRDEKFECITLSREVNDMNKK